ncbi:hypothetical protein D3C80_1086470 [compost metagenome]
MPPALVGPLRQLQRGDRRADLLQQGEQVALEAEQGVLARAAPVTVGVGRDQAGDDGALTVRLIIQIDRTDLEQGRVGVTARGVARRRLDQVGQDRRPHAVEVRRDGVFQHQTIIAAAEQGGRRLLGEGPGHGLGVAQGGQGPPGDADAGLTRAEHAARMAGDLGQGRVRQGAEALDTRHLLDQISAPLDVATP